MNADVNKQLLLACEEMLGYIEMTLAHDGALNVDKIMENLKRVKQVCSIETSHHLGCSQTTRKVDLQNVRSVIALAKEGDSNE